MSPDKDPSGEVKERTAPVSRFRAEALAERSTANDFGRPLPSVFRRAADPAKRPIPWTERVAGFCRSLTDRKRIPLRLQSQLSDCGPACLAMVLGYFGIESDLEQLREQTGAGRDGVSARLLLDTARRHGLTARGVRTNLAGLRDLPRGSILFWQFSHFVVLHKATADTLEIVDPAYGRRRLSMEDAGRAYTGVALEFQAPPADGARPARPLGSRPAGYWRYLRLFFPRTRVWPLVLLASLLLLPFSLAVPLLSEYIVDHVSAGHPLRPSGTFALIAATLVAGYFALQLIRSLAVVAIQAYGDKAATTGILQRLSRLPYDFFLVRSPGDLATRVRMSTTMRQTLTNSTLTAVADGVLVIVYGVLLFASDVRVATTVSVIAALQVGVLILGWRRQHDLVCDVLESQAQAQGRLVEMLEGMTTLKSSGLENIASERCSHALVEEIGNRARAGRSLARWNVSTVVFQFTAPAAVLVVGAVSTGSASSPGKIVAYGALALGLFSPLSSLVQAGLQTAGLGASLARLGDIIEAKPESSSSTIGTVAHGAVEARGVSFAYHSQGRPVLDDVSLSIRPGSFTVIVGASGSGKSTLAAALAGLHLPTSGQIEVDGLNTRDVDRSHLRRSIGYVNQDAQLFSGTLFENITLGLPVPRYADVRAAALDAEVHEQIRALPMSYQTLLTSGGTGLSGGQRQRVALARALIRRPALLILDEATSAVDPETEHRIFQNIRRSGCTLVAVAHRLSAIEEADQIIVMADGKIAHQGDYRELRETQTQLLSIRGYVGPAVPEQTADHPVGR